MGSSVRSAFPRSRHSATGRSSSSDSLLITHRFHLLSGCRVTVLFSKRRAGRLVFVCEGGPAGRVTVPVSWTDRGPASSANRLTVEGLVELDTLAKVLGDR